MSLAAIKLTPFVKQTIYLLWNSELAYCWCTESVLASNVFKSCIMLDNFAKQNILFAALLSELAYC
jgi:hypothetical protein